MNIHLILKGKVPSKKNRYLVGRGGRFYIDPVVSKWMTDAGWQIKEQVMRHGYKNLPLKNHIEVVFHFYTDNRSDLDNLVSSILDLLQKQNIIHNDRNVISIQAHKFLGEDTIQSHLWITGS